jgi:hypothetical protein
VKTFSAVIIILLCSILSGGCASIHKPLPQKQQISLSDAEKIISSIQEQGDRVRSFYAIGLISIKGRILDLDADILIAGVRDPFTMKIEISHSWGPAILHILIKNGRLEVLSFQEKVLYTGAFTPEALSIFLPGLNLDQEMIWAILSGRPPIVTHEIIKAPGTDRISLMDNDGTELEAIYLPIEGHLPNRVNFPEQSLDAYFFDFKEDSGIFYAGETKLSGKKIERDLTLKTKQMKLNASIPDEIFTLESPSTYKTVDLDKLSEQTFTGNSP